MISISSRSDTMPSPTLLMPRLDKNDHDPSFVPSASSSALPHLQMGMVHMGPASTPTVAPHDPYLIPNTTPAIRTNCPSNFRSSSSPTWTDGTPKIVPAQTLYVRSINFLQERREPVCMINGEALNTTIPRKELDFKGDSRVAGPVRGDLMRGPRFNETQPVIAPGMDRSDIYTRSVTPCRERSKAQELMDPGSPIPVIESKTPPDLPTRGLIFPMGSVKRREEPKDILTPIENRCTGIPGMCHSTAIHAPIQHLPCTVSPALQINNDPYNPNCPFGRVRGFIGERSLPFTDDLRRPSRFKTLQNPTNMSSPSPCSTSSHPEGKEVMQVLSPNLTSHEVINPDLPVTRREKPPEAAIKRQPVTSTVSPCVPLRHVPTRDIPMPPPPPPPGEVSLAAPKLIGVGSRRFPNYFLDNEFHDDIN